MKTNLDNSFKVVHEEVDFAIDDITSFKVRYFNTNSPKFKAAMMTHYKPHARQVELGTISPEKALEINVKVFVDTCLVSWKGVLDGDKNPIEFSRENAIELFKGLPVLFDSINAYAQDYKNYKEDMGNS